MTAGFKTRSERRKVLIRARMCVAGRWSDVCILNLSDRGLGLQAAVPPQRGVYLEVRRGPHVIIARVAWVEGRRFGARTQHLVSGDALLRDEPAKAEQSGQQAVERRAAVRSAAERHESNRHRARTLEFACVAAIGMAVAAGIAQVVGEAVATPLASVSEALRPAALVRR